MQPEKLTQGSEEWLDARLGKPTASNFHRIITPKGAPSRSAGEYAYRLIAERLLQYPMPYLSNGGRGGGSGIYAVERGRALEATAAAAFTSQFKLDLEPVGFVVSKCGRMGASPDRLVRGRNQAVEIKCPMPWTHIGYLLDGLGDEYHAQVQGQLMIGEYDCVHFFSFHPQMPSFSKTAVRHEQYIRALRGMLLEFCDMLDRQTDRARSLGAFTPGNLEQRQRFAAELGAVDHMSTEEFLNGSTEVH